MEFEKKPIDNMNENNRMPDAINPDRARERRIQDYTSTFGKYPYHAAAMQWVDEIIDPRDTRPMLIQGLRQLSKKKKSERAWKKHGNFPF